MITINDKIQVRKIQIGGEDLFVLTNLYMPIMGIDSFGLYIFLNNSEEEIYVRTILDFLHFENVGVLEYSLNKLEALGLVNKYQSKTKGYLYSFIRPVSKESFKNNSLLANMLISNIGEVVFTNLVKEDNLKGYNLETKRFDEVFKNKGTINKVFEANVPKEIKDNIIVKNEKFDYVVFKMLFDDNEIDKDLLNDSNFEKEILKISYQYSLNEEEMKDAVIKSIKQNQDLRYEDIRQRAGYIYQSKAPETVLFKEKKPEEYIVDLTSDENQILKWATTKSISDMLAMFSGGKGSLADIRDFTKLCDVTGLPVEVINVLIFHLCGIKGGEGLSFNYLEKVARNWIKAGIITAKDALIFIREKKETKEEVKKGRKSVAAVPDWMKEKKEVKEEKNFTDDEAKELLKKVFG